MRKHLVKLLRPFLDECGLSLLRKKDYNRILVENRILRSLSVQKLDSDSIHPDSAAPHFIIFSKDRALQLHALLTSMLFHISGRFHLSVLYKASDEKHAAAYKGLQGEFAEQSSWTWVEDEDFQLDLIRILEASHQQLVSFLVDDILFIRQLDLQTLNLKQFSDGVLSLRLGSNICYSYTQRKATELPHLDAVDQSGKLFTFHWLQKEPDWNYPISVDGHFFQKDTIQAACQETSFRAPNSFESALQILKPTFADRPGYCFEMPRIVNIPLNRVQTEVENFSGEISQDFLLDKWNEGYQIDIEAFSDVITRGVHEELEVVFVKRSKNLTHPSP